MPLFFANEMTGNRESRRGISGKKNRVRTSASNFITLVFVHFISVFLSLTYETLHIYAYLVSFGYPGTVIVESNKVPSYTPLHPFSACIPVTFPNIMMAFKKNNFPTPVREIIESLPGKSMLGHTGDLHIYLFDKPSMATVSTLIDQADFGVDTAQPTRLYIRHDHITAYHILLSRITVIATALFHLSQEDPGNVGNRSNSWFRSDELVQAHVAKPVLDDEEEGVVGGDIEVAEAEYKNTYNDKMRLSVEIIVKPADRSQRPWGPVTTLPRIKRHTTAHLCPYERNFSQPDLHAFVRFLSTFKSFFTSDDMNLVQTAWVDSIHNTEQGEVLAHMMKTLVLCFDGHGAPHFLIHPVSSNYYGSILYGVPSITTLGGKVEPIDISDLPGEISDQKFHDSELAKVVVAAGLQVNPESIKTMRQLHNLIVPGKHLPGTVMMASLSRLVANLDFGERPLTGSPADWEQVIHYLTHVDEEIPDTMFFHHTAFFTTDRTSAVLTAFGETVPSLDLGIKRSRVSAIVNPSVDKDRDLPPYDPSGPKILQTKFTSLENAVRNWNATMSKGVAMLETDRVIDNGRVYSGEQKVHFWKLLSSMCSITVPRALGNSGSILSKGSKRKELDSTPDETTGSKMKKAKKSMF
jgi:hypothetical protein